MSAAVAASLAVAAAGLLSFISSFLRNSDPEHDRQRTGTAYILENTVTHARLLPVPATHAFSYPTLALLLALDALEAGALDLGRGWLFGYGGTAWRLTGLRSGAYLLPDVPGGSSDEEGGKTGVGREAGTEAGKGKGKGAIKTKLAEVLVRQGVDAERVRKWTAEGDAWMLTMPSYVGYEGINPLTVYFCYSPLQETEGAESGEGEGALAWVVLEIHNTFGEKHVHVLEPGVNEDQRQAGYAHTWTFARDFHVSPFNDRSGFYTVSVAAPPPPRSPRLAAAPPRPKIRILLRTASPAPAPAPSSSPSSDSDSDAQGPVPDKLKLTATLFARRAAPLTSASLLRALARYPFALLLSFARILYHAGILHYKKGLDVFPRPDPKPAVAGAAGDGRVPGGIGWQPEGALEAYARGLAERHLARRAEELGVRIALVSGDPSVPQQVFGPSTRAQEKQRDDDPAGEADLTIYYAAPRFFTTLLLAPSPGHMLLLGRAEGLFRVSSESLFSQVFSPTFSSAKASLTQRIRTSLLPQDFVTAASAATPARHPLDDGRPLRNAAVVCTLHLMDNLEKRLFSLLGARFVPGTEPWGRWDRAANLARTERGA